MTILLFIMSFRIFQLLRGKSREKTLSVFFFSLYLNKQIKTGLRPFIYFLFSSVAQILLDS